MRKVFLDDLPRYMKGAYKGKINWKECVGHKFRFIYDDIENELEIIKYVRKNNKPTVDVKYKNNIFNINTDSILYCYLGVLLGVVHKEYMYEINDILDQFKNGRIKILEKIKIKIKRGKSHGNNIRYLKGYKCKCLICGNVFEKIEDELKNHGCAVCSGLKVLKGYNDLWTTHPETASLLKNKEIGYIVSFGSHEDHIFICPYCKREKVYAIKPVVKHGISCICSDNIPYPEKFIVNVLSQLDINFTTQLSKRIFPWCKNYRYDNYINDINCIVETHGKQHYEENNHFKMSLNEVQENDKNKEILAIKNGVENYIIIDCRESELEWIKNSIMNSEPNLPKLLNFKEEDINWRECHEYACSNLVKESCKLWNDGVNNTSKIADKLKISKSTVIKYLKQGVELKLCNYNPKEESIKSGKNNGGKNKKKIICLTTGEVFKSQTKACEKYNISVANLSSCCRKIHKSAGRSTTTKEYLLWMFYDEYLIKNQQLGWLEEYINSHTCGNVIKVICLTTGEIFKSQTVAGEKYNISPSGISGCCDINSINKSAGKHPDTGEYMVWMYYEDYILKNEMQIESILESVQNKIICLTTGEVFNTQVDAFTKYNVNKSGICNCCNNKAKYAGKHPITNEPLVWQYYSEYIKSNQLPTAI